MSHLQSIKKKKRKRCFILEEVGPIFKDSIELLLSEELSLQKNINQCLMSYVSSF